MQSLLTLLFGLPQMLAITIGIDGVNDVHSVAQEAFVNYGFL
jgi:hypothetical protein